MQENDAKEINEEGNSASNVIHFKKTIATPKEEQFAIVTLGNSHFVFPIFNASHNLSDDVTAIRLKDGSKMTVGTNNLILFTGSSKLINAMLESGAEDIYAPEKEKGKIKMKKIAIDNPFEGKKHE